MDLFRGRSDPAVSGLRKTLIALTALGGLLLGWGGEVSAIITETTAESGLPAGVTTVSPGAQVQIYRVGLTRTFPPGPNTDRLASITITISDLTVPTGLAPGDFTQLNLIRSADATLDGGDPIIGTQPVVAVGAPTTIAPAAAETFGNPETKFFFITAVMNASAGGKSFKVGAAGGGILVNTGGGPPTQNIGSGFAALDGNSVLIVWVPRPIPVMPPALYGILALLLLGYGIYSLKRRGP